MQMVNVHRRGSIVQIPRRLSFHVPTVPILDSESLENKLNVKFHDIDSDEFQMYKTASEEEYGLSVAEVEIVGQQKFKVKKKSKNQTEVEKKVLFLLKGSEVSTSEMIKILQSILSFENLEQMKNMLENGKKPEEVIEYFLEQGVLRKETVSEKMKLLIGERELSKEEIFKLLKTQLGEKCQEEMEKMLLQGYSMQEVIDYYLNHGKTQEEEAFELKHKMRSLIEEGKMTPEDMIGMLKSSLSERERKIVEEMIKNGMDIGDIIKKMIENREEEVYGAQSISREESLDNLRLQQGDITKEELENMLKKGHSLLEVMDTFMKPCSQDAMPSDLQDKLTCVLNRSDLNSEEKLDILQSNLSEQDRKLVEAMIKSGMSVDDVVRQMVDNKMIQGGIPSEGTLKHDKIDSLNLLDIETEFAQRIRELVGDKSIDDNELFLIIDENLNEAEKARLNDMMSNGYSKTDIIKYFLKYAEGRIVSEFEKEIKSLIACHNFTEVEILDLLRSKLGPESLLKMDQLISDGYSNSEVIKILIESGRTGSVEEDDLKSTIENFVSDKTISTEEKVDLVKNQLNNESRTLMEELLKQGYAKEEVMDLFLRCANDLEQINNDKLFKKRVRFAEEPPDAYLYEERDVWSMINPAEVKLNIPFMTTSAKCVTFARFFEKVVQFIKGMGLTHREILDLIRLRMGGDYAKEFDELRSQCRQLQEIVDYFLYKDESNRQDSMRKARLRAQAKIDAELNLKRSAYKEQWGIQMHYAYRYHSSLQGLLTFLTLSC